MDIRSMRPIVLNRLHGRLWHTTHPDRFKHILESGVILPSTEAENPDGWRTMSGDPYRSFAHTLGAVSLFDFDQFDPESYATKWLAENRPQPLVGCIFPPIVFSPPVSIDRPSVDT